jgi:hypothetical protein
LGPGIPLSASAHWAHVSLYAITLQRIDWFRDIKKLVITNLWIFIA